MPVVVVVPMGVVVGMGEVGDSVSPIVLARARRQERGRFLERLEVGEIAPWDVLESLPESLEGMFVFDFLRRLPRVGPRKVREINRLAVRFGINLAVTLGDLTTAKRVWLAEVLRSTPHTGRMPSGLRGPQ